MLLDLAVLSAGLGCLEYGSQATVEAASSVAHRLDVSTLFVGVTVVAVGSSIPEIATSIYGSLYGTGDFVVAHVVGSATSQITLGVGIVALSSTITVPCRTVRRYGSGMVLAMTAMLVAVRLDALGRAVGLLLGAAYVGFLLVRFEHDEYHREFARLADPDRSNASLAAGLLGGVALVVGGGHLLVVGASATATSLGAPWYLLGLVTGLGTTVPEIAVAVTSISRDEAPIAVGTLLGSNITDPLFSLGVGAAVGGLALGDPRTATRGAAYMLGVSVVVLAVAYWRETLGPLEGAVCTALYLPAFFLG